MKPEKNRSLKERLLDLFRTEDEDQQEIRYEGKPMGRLMRYMKPYRRVFVLCLLLVLALTALELIRPIIIGNAIDQYITTHPDYFLKQSPEHALLNPDNLYVLLSHFKCAAFELPFDDGDSFGATDAAPELLSYLEDSGILHHVEGRWHWTAEDFPASEISLRSAASENFVIIDITDPANHRVIGEMDRYTVPMLLHENAIYMHEARQYQVERLDFDACKAYIRQVDTGYYTDANLNISLELLDIEDQAEETSGLQRTYGEVKVTTLVTMFKKIRFDTHETLGFGHVRLPETDMHTTALWWTLPDALCARFGQDTLKNGMLAISNLLRIVEIGRAHV